MYDSPIEVIYQDIQYSLENKILKACQDVNVNVNKEELIKALQYDRNQYQKGNTIYMTTLDYGELGRATGQRFFYNKHIG